jgi:uncharacterized protein (DUF488 family)
VKVKFVVSVVYTIGYEGTDIDRFVATLKAVGIEVLADVRAVAASRKKGFSKSALRARLEDEGIAYNHLVDLGDPKPGREAARAGRYDEFQTIYNKHFEGAEAQAALETLTAIVGESPTCLLCFERAPEICHRSIVADALRISGMEIFNLYGDDPDRYVRHAAKLPRYHPREGAPAA